jgi:hypothetical protein
VNSHGWSAGTLVPEQPRGSLGDVERGFSEPKDIIKLRSMHHQRAHRGQADILVAGLAFGGRLASETSCDARPAGFRALLSTRLLSWSVTSRQGSLSSEFGFV